MVLVTGGSGLLGSELIRQLLLQGKPVTAIINNTALPNFNSPLLTQVRCNILDVVLLESLMQQGIEEVYHCAALVSFDPVRKKELFKINLEGTANIVNAAINAGVRKLVYVSSVAALGNIKDGETVTEIMNWTGEKNNSNYGESKYLAELEVWRGAGEGLQVVIVNPSIILGAGNWNDGSSQIFKSVYDGFPWYANGINGFADVRDVAGSMVQLMQSNITEERFIISAANKSYRDIFNLIAKAFNKKGPYKAVTPFLAKLIWRIEAVKSRFTGKSPLVTKETATTALAKVYYDNSKLLQFLPGFKYHSIEQTITDTCAVLQQKVNTL